MVDFAKWLRDLVSKTYPDAIVKYLQNELILRFAEYNRIWIHERKNNRMYIRLSVADQAAVIDELTQRKIACTPASNWGVSFSGDIESLKALKTTFEWLTPKMSPENVKID